MKAVASVPGGQSEVTVGQQVWQMRKRKVDINYGRARTNQNPKTNRTCKEKLEHAKKHWNRICLLLTIQVLYGRN